MKLPCAVIQDLLPLYAEDLTSDVSRTLVEEHLPECEDCRRQLEELKAPMPQQIPCAVPMQQVRTMLKKQLWLTVVLTACVMLAFFVPFLYYLMQPADIFYYDGLVTIQEKEDGSLALTFAEPYTWLSASSILDNDKTIDARELRVGSVPRIHRFLHTNIGSREALIANDFGSPDLIFYVNPDGEAIHLWGEIPDGYELDNLTPEFIFNNYLLGALGLCGFCSILWLLFRKKRIGVVFCYAALFFLSYVLGHFLITGNFGPYYQLFNRHFSRITSFILATAAALFGAFCTTLSLRRLHKDK